VIFPKTRPITCINNITDSLTNFRNAQTSTILMEVLSVLTCNKTGRNYRKKEYRFSNSLVALLCFTLIVLGAVLKQNIISYYNFQDVSKKGDMRDYQLRHVSPSA